MNGEAFAVATLPFDDTSKNSSNKRKMAPESGFEIEAAQPKKGRGHAFDTLYHRGSSNPSISNTTSSEPATEWWPKANRSSLSSSATSSSFLTANASHAPSTASRSFLTANASPPYSTANPNFPTASPGHDTNFKTPDKKSDDLQTSLLEATKRAAVAERKAAEYLQGKNDAERKLLENHSAGTALTTANQKLTAENQSLKDEFAKLEKHTKNCEKATGRAQKEAKNAKGHADHLINSQKGQLRNAERRYEEAARELKEWRDTYGWSVGKPSEEKYALQVRLSEWQSKAEKARNEIAALKAGLQGQQQGITGAEDQPSSTVAMQDPNSTRADQDPNSNETEGGNQSSAAAEAKATRYKGETDTLYRMLQEEVARNAKLAESLVLRNAKLAASLEGCVTDVGTS